MHETIIRWGDGFITLSPAFPESLLNKLKYWRRTLEWDSTQMRRITAGQYEELYQVRSWVNDRQTICQELITMPGFMHLVKQTLNEEGWAYKVLDERTPLPTPDLIRACQGLRDYQIPIAYTAIMSGGGIVSAATGVGKCVAPATPIIWADGHVDKIQAAQAGDLLMGDDSTPRRVIERIDGIGPMYRITPIYGDAFEAADHHILRLVMTDTDEIVDMTISDLLAQTDYFRHRAKLYKVGVEFPARPVSIDPYYLGMWLGNGTWNSTQITTPFLEVTDYLRKLAADMEGRTSDRRITDGIKCFKRSICGARWGNNKTLNGLRACGLTRNKKKHIPREFMINSTEVRLQVLAGMLDSDGYLEHSGHCFDWCSVDKEMARDFTFLARSLGFRASENTAQVEGFGKVVTRYRVHVSGDIDRIPTIVVKRQAKKRAGQKDILRCGFKIEKIADGPYVGVRLDGNMLHLLGDFTVTHNTHIVKAIADAFSYQDLQARGTPLTVITTPDQDITAKDFKDIKELLPHREVGLVMAGYNNFSDDIQVITLDSLHRINPDEVGILIVDEVHTAASDKRSDSLLQMRKAAKWGVSATPMGRFDGRDLVTEGIFGPVVSQYSFADGVRDGALVPITVCWVTAPEPAMGLERYARYSQRTSKYRHGLTHNEGRNRTIGEIIRSIPAGHQTLCILQFLSHMDALVPHCGPGIAIVHAETDAKKIAGHNNLYPISARDRRSIYQKMERAEVDKIVSTYVYKQGVNFPQLEIVINAGGGGSDIVARQIPGRESRKTDAKERAYLVDFWHPWDQAKDKRGRLVAGPINRDDIAREKAYSSLGFEQIWIKDLTELPFLKGQSPRTLSPEQ